MAPKVVDKEQRRKDIADLIHEVGIKPNQDALKASSDFGIIFLKCFQKFCSFVPFLVASECMSATIIECPHFVYNAQVIPKDVPVGWTPYVYPTLRLNSIGFMAGPPDTRTDLKPIDADSNDRKNKNKYKSTSTWVWEEEEFIREKWITCGYDVGNSFSLSKRISDTTKKCTVTYTKNKDGQLNFPRNFPVAECE